MRTPAQRGTGSHEADDADIAGDLAYFLDFDIAILGSGESEYDTYTRNIRLEYSSYPDDAYKKGKKSILKSFLEKRFLYNTDAFRSRFETRARENLFREIPGL